MKSPETLRFLASHYYDLQGVRFAPIYLTGLSVFIWSPHKGMPLEAILAVALSILVTVLWNWWMIGFFRSRFGTLSTQPVKVPLSRTLFAIVPASLAIGFFMTRNPHPLAGFVPWVCMMSWLLGRIVVDASNLLLRRLYYALGLLAFVPLAALPMQKTVGLGCTDMLVMALLDLVLLLSLFRPAEVEAHG